jgi:hypothetical protein
MAGDVLVLRDFSAPNTPRGGGDARHSPDFARFYFIVAGNLHVDEPVSMSNGGIIPKFRGVVLPGDRNGKKTSGFSVWTFLLA